MFRRDVHKFLADTRFRPTHKKLLLRAVLHFYDVKDSPRSALGYNKVTGGVDKKKIISA